MILFLPCLPKDKVGGFQICYTLSFSGTNNKRSYTRGSGVVHFATTEDPNIGSNLGAPPLSPRFSQSSGEVKPLLISLDKVLHQQCCFETHTGKQGLTIL